MDKKNLIRVYGMLEWMSGFLKANTEDDFEGELREIEHCSVAVFTEITQ